MLYEHTIGELQKMIINKFPEAVPESMDIDTIDRSDHARVCRYILWMFDEIKTFTNKVKAGRWIGWILSRMEEMGFIENKDSRNMTREDKRLGNT